MTKKLLSALLIWTILLGAISPALFAQENQPQTKEQKQAKKERDKFRKEAAGHRGKCGKRGKLDTAIKLGTGFLTGKKIDPIALSLGALFNDQLPIKLDACSVYEEVPTPDTFNPVFFQPTIANLETPLPPGDYTLPVRAICTKDSIHIPGQGVGYKLAPLEGKQALTLATLITRGNIAGVPHETLQRISWSIQASIPYSRMSKRHQAIVDELIPEFRNELNGDFLQQLENRYNQFVGENSKVLPFDELLEQAGISANVRSIRRSREIIRDESLDFQRMQQRLFDGEPGESQIFTPDKPETSPWTKMMPGVYVQYVVKGGWQGINELNLRITPQAGAMLSTPSPTSDVFYQRASFAPNRANANPIAIGIIFGIIRAVGTRAVVGAGVRSGAGTAIRYNVTRGLISYSVAHATQALIILPNVQHGDGGNDPCENFRQKRAEYEAKVRDLKRVSSRMLYEGKSDEEIARTVTRMRREIGVQYKDITPEPFRSEILQRNIQRYKDPLGPTVEYLR